VLFFKEITFSVYQSRKALTSANLNGIRLIRTVFVYRGKEKMGENQKALPPTGASPTDAGENPESATADDAALLALEDQFDVLVTELARVQETNRGRSDSKSFDPGVERLHDQVRCEARTTQLEAILTSLSPIERAIMQTPACTITGLGVKARHAAYVVSEYWEVPLEQIDWDARVIRLLIEAVCDFTRTPLNNDSPIERRRFSASEERS
jgi:hypothetical protein